MQTISMYAIVVLSFLGLICAAATAADHHVLACVGGTVYPSPTAAPIKDATLLVEDGKITAVNVGFPLPAMAVNPGSSVIWVPAEKVTLAEPLIVTVVPFPAAVIAPAV